MPINFIFNTMKIRTLTQAFLLLFCLSNFSIHAQIGINATGDAPATNAMLDVSSTTKGALLPRMTTAQRTALTSSDGLTVYDTDTKSYWFVKGTVWTEMVGGAGGGIGPWTVSGTNIYNANTGNVGIGVSNPDYPLVTKGRIRIRDLGAGESAGIWFNNNGNTALNTFIGIDPNNRFGIYSPTLFNNIFLANMANGNIGIGLDPSHKLHIANNPVGNTAGLRVEGPLSSGGYIASFGGFGDFVVDKPGIVGGRFIIKNNGNVGIGNNNPTVPLDITGIMRISNGSIFINNTPSVSNGIGSYDGYLRLIGGDALGGNGVWINNTGSVFGGIKFNTSGSIEIGGSEGAPGQLLTSNGSGSAAIWKTIPKTQHVEMSDVSYIVPNNNLNMIPGATVSFTAPVAGKLIIWSNFRVRFSCANPLDHCYLAFEFRTFLNGNEIKNTELQTTIAYPGAVATFYNNHAIAPISISVDAGTHTISFGEILNSITPGPTVYASTYAQFIPN